MYYKDDFYKEFRTEKELCEYLEEIDSRAEWIRHFPGSTGKRYLISFQAGSYPAREDLLYRKFSNQIVERTGQD